MDRNWLEKLKEECKLLPIIKLMTKKLLNLEDPRFNLRIVNNSLGILGVCTSSTMLGMIRDGEICLEVIMMVKIVMITRMEDGEDLTGETL